MFPVWPKYVVTAMSNPRRRSDSCKALRSSNRAATAGLRVPNSFRMLFPSVPMLLAALSVSQ